MDRAAIFLDRDGTLIRHREYLADPALVELLPGVAAALRHFQAAGYALVLISNQGGIALGYFDEAAVHAVNARMCALLAAEHVQLDALYFCPHHPRTILPAYPWPCACRKPAPGMILRACQDLQLAPRRSWMIGDQPLDIGAGQNAGCCTVLLRPPAEAAPAECFPTYIAADLLAAAQLITGAQR